MIPAFDTDGNLPQGVHETTWDLFTDRFGRTPHRQRLVRGLEAGLAILGLAGCRRVYVDGSFVTSKLVPNDYDAAWEPGGVDLLLLKSMEPVFFEFANFRAAQKAKFFGEYFPSSAKADRSGCTFWEFFQIDKNTGNPKGIIALNL